MSRKTFSDSDVRLIATLATTLLASPEGSIANTELAQAMERSGAAVEWAKEILDIAIKEYGYVQDWRETGMP